MADILNETELINHIATSPGGHIWITDDQVDTMATLRGLVSKGLAMGKTISPAGFIVWEIELTPAGIQAWQNSVNADCE